MFTHTPAGRTAAGVSLLIALTGFGLAGCSGSSTDAPSDADAPAMGDHAGDGARVADAEFEGTPASASSPQAAPLDAGSRYAMETAEGHTRVNDEGIPIVSGGRPIQRSALADAPGYTPIDDPELESVARGRRIVDPLPDSVQLTEAKESREALAEAIVAAINAEDSHALDHLRISFEEFRDIYWREDPSSRPVTRIPVEESWGFLWRSSVSGAKRLVEDHGGQGLTFDHIEYRVGVTPFASFDLYRGIRLVCTDENGETVHIDGAYTWIVRDGRWKVYIYKD